MKKVLLTLLLALALPVAAAVAQNIALGERVPEVKVPAWLADAEAKGIRLIDKTPRKGAEGMTIAFLHPKSTQGILTELCENKNK